MPSPMRHFPTKPFLDNLQFFRCISPDADATDFRVFFSYGVFVKDMQEKGLSDFISFDNKLNFDEVVLDHNTAAKWLVYEFRLNRYLLTICGHSFYGGLTCHD